MTMAKTYKGSCHCGAARYAKARALRVRPGEDALSEYMFGQRRMVATLGDASPAELIRAPVQYFNGRHDNWNAAPAETAHL